jgi:hypothetical protein
MSAAKSAIKHIALLQNAMEKYESTAKHKRLGLKPATKISQGLCSEAPNPACLPGRCEAPQHDVGARKQPFIVFLASMPNWAASLRNA